MSMKRSENFYGKTIDRGNSNHGNWILKKISSQQICTAEEDNDFKHKLSQQRDFDEDLAEEMCDSLRENSGILYDKEPLMMCYLVSENNENEKNKKQNGIPILIDGQHRVSALINAYKKYNIETNVLMKVYFVDSYDEAEKIFVEVISKTSKTESEIDKNVRKQILASYQNERLEKLFKYEGYHFANKNNSETRTKEETIKEIREKNKKYKLSETKLIERIKKRTKEFYQQKYNPYNSKKINIKYLENNYSKKEYEMISTFSKQSVIALKRSNIMKFIFDKNIDAKHPVKDSKYKINKNNKRIIWVEKYENKLKGTCNKCKKNEVKSNKFYVLFHVSPSNGGSINPKSANILIGCQKCAKELNTNDKGILQSNDYSDCKNYLDSDYIQFYEKCNNIKKQNKKIISDSSDSSSSESESENDYSDDFESDMEIESIEQDNIIHDLND